jgi:adenylate cyclase
VVNAVGCAVAIQQGIAEIVSIQLRIGINVGDVVVENGDVFGDGVNVASRVASLAPPGGIALTETVREHMGGRLNLEFKDTGTHSLKNISRPIRAFVIGGEKATTHAAEPPYPQAFDSSFAARKHEWRMRDVYLRAWLR